MNPVRSHARAKGASPEDLGGATSNGMNPILSLIRLYHRVSLWFRSAQVPGFTYTTCKYHPSCSEYAELAVLKYGIVRGSWKALIRIIRCNPFASGGVDYP